MLTGAQKAIAAMVITLITGTLTVVATYLPDSRIIQLAAGIGAGVLGVVATTLGVYQTQNGTTLQPVQTLSAVPELHVHLHDAETAYSQTAAGEPITAPAKPVAKRSHAAKVAAPPG